MPVGLWSFNHPGSKLAQIGDELKCKEIGQQISFLNSFRGNSQNKAIFDKIKLILYSQVRNSMF